MMLDLTPPDATRVEVPSPIESALPAAPSGVTARRRVGRRGRRVLLGLGGGLLAVTMFAAGAGIDRAGLLPGNAASAGVAEASPHAGAADLALVDEAWDLLHQNYVDAASLDSKKLAYAAIDGMTEAIGDTGHTEFLTPRELAQSQAALAGSYVGIGAELDTRDDEPIIVGVFRGSPASAAGLQRGDVIVAVDGVPSAGKPLDGVIGMVRGKAGTAVILTVRRSGTADPLTLRIIRADVKIPAVEWSMIPGTSIVDIRLEQFSTGAADEFVTALKAALAKSPTGIVLDLRGNPGGYVNEAVGVASQFLSGGDVYLSQDASGTRNPTPVSPGGIALDMPLVVLVDEGTASSAEIVTGALQDARRATIVGAKTFGTGTVLGRFELADGSALRIGTVQWLTPKGRRIWHDGLAPDVKVALPEGVQPVLPSDLAGLGAKGVASSADAQLREALEILR